MKRIFFLVGLFLLIFIAVFAITKFINRNNSNFVYEGHMIYEVDNLPQNKYAAQGNNLIIATTKKTFCIRKNGDILWEHAAFCANPKLQTAGNFALVADINGQNIYLFKNGKLILEKTLDNSIFNASVNEKGCITVSTVAEGFSSKVTVFNQFGTEIYFYSSSEDFAIDAVLAKNNRNLAISFYGTRDGEIISSICFIDVISQKVLERPSFVNLIIPSLIFNDNEKLLAIGDTATLLYNKKGHNIWINRYNGQTLTDYVFNKNKRYSLLFENAVGTVTAKTFNFRNKPKREKEIDFYPKNISQGGKKSLLTGDRKFALMNKKGKITETGHLRKNYSIVILTENNKNFYGISANSIELIKIK
ncbi:MAG: DUF5711 family protein [Oscillospiraceae bacterium]|nr:DUF5711 family protein [Oscillospiraceae bacterium]